MGLKLIYGKSGTGKTWSIYNNIKNIIDEDPNKKVYVIVPEQYSLSAEKEIIEFLNKKGIINIQVFTFKRLAYRILADVGGISKTVLSKATQNMLIKNIFEENKSNLKYFNKSITRNSFVQEITDLMEEFKNYGVKSNTLKNINPESNELKLKLEELELIYKRYDEKIQEKGVTLEDRLEMACNKLNGSSIFNNAEIFIDNFNGFTEIEYRIIEKLLKRVENVTITLCINDIEEDLDRLDIYSINKQTFKRLNKICDQNAITFNQPLEVIGNKRTESLELKHLQENLFKFPHLKYLNTVTDIKIVMPQNHYNEVEFVAKNICYLIKEKNFRYKDIGITTNNIDTYEEIFTDIFKKYNINFFIDTKKSLEANPLINLVISLIEIFENNFTYESVFKYLKVGFINIDINDVDYVENFVLKYGIRGKNSWENHFTDEKADIIREKIYDPLNCFKSKLVGRKTVEDIIKSIFEHFEIIGINDILNRKIQFFIDNNLNEYAEEYRQVWSILVNVCDEICEIFKDEKITFEKFVEYFKLAVSQYEIGIMPNMQDYVIIGDVQRTKSHEIKALFIIGANDGIFPKSTYTEGILSETDRHFLKSQGIELAKDINNKIIEEQFLINQIFSMPSKYLCISYPASTLEGKALRPSIFINRIKNIFPEIIIESDNFDIQIQQSIFDKLCEKIRDYNNENEFDESFLNILGWYYKNYPEKMNRILDGLDFSNKYNNISSSIIRQLYGMPMKSSVSRLEQFEKCPLSHYLKYGLKLKEREIYKLRTLEIGTFLHNVIERFTRNILENNLNWKDIDNEFIDNCIQKYVDEELAGASDILASSKRFFSLVSKLKRILKRVLTLIVDHINIGNFVPYACELEFGEDKEILPIVVETSIGDKIYLTGKIDRLDILKEEDKTYLRIIDYKSGEKNLSYQDIMDRLQLQLITYMSAIVAMQNSQIGRDLTPAGMLYLTLKDPIANLSKNCSEQEVENEIKKQLKMRGIVLNDSKIIKAMHKNISGFSEYIPVRINAQGEIIKNNSNVIEEEQFMELCKSIKGILGNIADEILKGDISNRPNPKLKQSPCEYCEYKILCE